MIWVCGCGCSTFELLSDGKVRCAMCEDVTEAENGGWHPPEDAPEWEGEPPVRDLNGNGSVEFARAAMVRYAKAKEATMIIVADEDGSIHAWSAAETDEQIAWVKSKLEQAAQLLSKNFDKKAP
jgi:uncharacterized Zn finger protein (UPF0148 family)